MTTIKLNISAWGSGKTSSMYQSINSVLESERSVLIVGCSLKQLETYKSKVGSGIICSSVKSRINVKSQIISALQKAKVVYCTGIAFSTFVDTDDVDFKQVVVFLDEMLNAIETTSLTTKKSDTVSITDNDSSESIILNGSFTVDTLSLYDLRALRCPWNEINIYGANALMTPFGRLLELSDIPFEIVSDFESVDFSKVRVLCPKLSGQMTRSMKESNPYIVKSMLKVIAKNNPKQKFVYISNSYDSIVKSRYGIRMPHNVAGDNNYRDIHIMLMLSTLNMNNPLSKKLCDLLECDRDYLTTMISVSTLFQSAFRTSLRSDIMSGDCVIVADAYLMGLAERHGFVKNLSIEYFDLFVPKTPKERSIKHRNN